MKTFKQFLKEGDIRINNGNGPVPPIDPPGGSTSSGSDSEKNFNEEFKRKQNINKLKEHLKPIEKHIISQEHNQDTDTYEVKFPYSSKEEVKNHIESKPELHQNLSYIDSTNPKHSSAHFHVKY